MSWKLGTATSGVLLFLLSQTPAFSGEHNHRQHGAHVHGAGHLNIAMDSGEIFMEFESPAANIVGFEHQAESAEDREKFNSASKLLKNVDKLFSFPAAAKCRALDVEFQADQEPGKEHSGSSVAASNKKNTQPMANEIEQHAEFKVAYHFQCTDINALQSIDVLIPKRFPNLNSLYVQIISIIGQTAKTVTAQDYTLIIQH